MKLINRFAPKLMSRRIALGFVVAMVLIASGFTISFYSYTQYREATKQVRHTYEVTSAIETILSLVKDVETGARGYALTNDPGYLEPYDLGVNQLPQEMARLRSLMGSNESPQKRVRKLEQLILAKLEITKVRINQPPVDKIASLKLSAEEKRRMDALRRQVAIMVDMEQILVELRNDQAERSFRHTIILIFSLSLLTFITLAISYRLLEQELLHRQETEDQLRAFEVKLKEQIRQLQASNDELERFAFVASHDLQEPLRKIQSFADLITERYSNLFDGDSRMFMNKISHSAERMSKLIKDLLNFSRISNHREDFEPVKLNDIVRRILDDQELRIKGLNVQVIIGWLPMIPAVSSQMDHLFNNLISNALKFVRTDAQPVLRIEARAVDGSDYPELVAGRRYFEIIIEDNGIGFDEKYLDHIFKVFQRLHGKTAFEGTGIGLAICKRVVVYHQGYITARSQPNQGTTFVVVLPESQLLQNYDRPNSTEAYSYTVG
ncbi:sensor histidine kinase [Spirosoma fluminis]